MKHNNLSQLDRLKKRAGGRCEICETKETKYNKLTKHHIHFLCRGGSNIMSNFECACQRCHKFFHKNEGKSLVPIKLFNLILNIWITKGYLRIESKKLKTNSKKRKATQKNKGKKFFCIKGIDNKATEFKNVIRNISRARKEEQCFRN